MINLSYFSKDELLLQLRSHVGFIPTQILFEENKIVWTDVGKYHFFESFFHRSISNYITLNKGKVTQFYTDLSVLEDSDILSPYIYPNGFIFHFGRSGSTLLAKAFSSSKKNLVASEPNILNQILLKQFRTDSKGFFETEKSKIMYKNLVLLLLSRRLKSHENAIIKFTSFNINFLQTILNIFPDVPVVVLERDVFEIVISNEKIPMGMQSLSPEDLFFFTKIKDFDTQKIVEVYKHFLINFHYENLLIVNYTDLADNFIKIISHFKLSFSSEEIDLMKAQFKFYSKTDFKKNLNQS